MQTMLGNCKNDSDRGLLFLCFCIYWLTFVFLYQYKPSVCFRFQCWKIDRLTCVYSSEPESNDHARDEKRDAPTKCEPQRILQQVCRENEMFVFIAVALYGLFCQFEQVKITCVARIFRRGCASARWYVNTRKIETFSSTSRLVLFFEKTISYLGR